MNYEYEIHITVEPIYADTFASVDGTENELKFKQMCEQLSVKPLIIHNQIRNGTARVMLTSSIHHGDDATVYGELRKIASQILKYKQFKIVREKIESEPSHPRAPKEYEDSMPNGSYFETHISVAHYGTDESRSALNSTVDLWNGHNPRETLYRSNNTILRGSGKIITWLTYRTTVSGYAFEYLTDKIVSELRHAFELQQTGLLEIDKVHKEFAIYDSNIAHDAAWMKSE